MATRSSSLPAPCKDCKGTNDWMLIERPSGISGMGRCSCERGQTLLAMSARPIPPLRAEPVLTADEISLAVEGLSSIPWFPKEEGARTMIADAIARLCINSQACFELVRFMVDGYREWPGVREMRICYCARIGCPLSGEDLHLAISEYHPDGFGTAITAPAVVALAPGMSRMIASAVKTLPATIEVAASGFDMEAAQQLRREFLRQQHREAIAALAKDPDYKPITQADIDQAVQELREKRARAELGETA